MRIIAEIPHPKYMVTAFRNGDKFSLKIVRPLLEKIIKCPETDLLYANDQFIKFIEDHILVRALELFSEEEKNIYHALKMLPPLRPTNEDLV